MFMGMVAAGEAGAGVAAPVVPALSPLEWRVVQLAKAEADRFGAAAASAAAGPARGLARWTARLFGREPIQRLADDRLEALRQFVCLARRRDRRLAVAAAALAAFGFAPATLEMLKASAVG